MNAPPSDEAPAGGAARGLEKVGQSVSHHHAAIDADPAVLRAEVERHEKRLATLRAELARRGYQLHVVELNGTSTFLIARWDRSRELRDLTAVAAFLQQIGAPQ